MYCVIWPFIFFCTEGTEMSAPTSFIWMMRFFCFCGKS